MARRIATAQQIVSEILIDAGLAMVSFISCTLARVNDSIVMWALSAMVLTAVANYYSLTTCLIQYIHCCAPVRAICAQ